MSDIDLQVLVNDSFKLSQITNEIRSQFKQELKNILWIEENKKLVVYLYDEYLLLEISIYYQKEGLDKYFLGSEIKDIDSSLLFDKDCQLKDYLQEKITQKTLFSTSQISKVKELIYKFTYTFERSSFAHKKSDSYKFYFLFNIAFHKVVQIMHLLHGEGKFNYLPPQFLNDFLSHKESEKFRSLSVTTYLPQANQAKRKLLEIFYLALDKFHSLYPNTDMNTDEIKNLCENIYQRDYLWNFRDISFYNAMAKPGIIYRSSSPTRYQEEQDFLQWLKKRNIRLIVDLRSHKEIAKNPYKQDLLDNICYLHLPIDPESQMTFNRNKYQSGTASEKLYRFFALECKDKIKTMLEHIIECLPYATLVHCHAGKDRTGAMISLIHLLISTPISSINNDYLASGSDTQMKKIQAFLDVIKDTGGIQQYLRSCMITDRQIEQLSQCLGHQYELNYA